MTPVFPLLRHQPLQGDPFFFLPQALQDYTSVTPSSTSAAFTPPVGAERAGPGAAATSSASGGPVAAWPPHRPGPGAQQDTATSPPWYGNYWLSRPDYNHPGPVSV